MLKNGTKQEAATRLGYGSIVCGYIYISDICSLMEKIISEDNRFEIHNFSTSVDANQNGIIQIILSCGLHLEVVYDVKRRVDVKCAVISSASVKEKYNKT